MSITVETIKQASYTCDRCGVKERAAKNKEYDSVLPVGWTSHRRTATGSVTKKEVRLTQADLCMTCENAFHKFLVDGYLKAMEKSSTKPSVDWWDTSNID